MADDLPPGDNLPCDVPGCEARPAIRRVYISCIPAGKADLCAACNEWIGLAYDKLLDYWRQHFDSRSRDQVTRRGRARNGYPYRIYNHRQRDQFWEIHGEMDELAFVSFAEDKILWTPASIPLKLPERKK